MATIDEIRRANLDLLAQEKGGNKALADLVGVSESQMGQWRKGLKNSTTGKPRGMRLESCHRIEAATGKPRGWLDTLHGPSAATGPLRLDLAEALEVLGIALARDMPDDVRDDVADTLAKMARRKGVGRHQTELLTLLQSTPGKRQSNG